jgi:hypothetical protein
LLFNGLLKNGSVLPTVTDYSVYRKNSKFLHKSVSNCIECNIKKLTSITYKHAYFTFSYSDSEYYVIITARYQNSKRSPRQDRKCKVKLSLYRPEQALGVPRG